MAPRTRRESREKFGADDLYHDAISVPFARRVRDRSLGGGKPKAASIHPSAGWLPARSVRTAEPEPKLFF
jgi:hypothetical protein